MQSPSTATGPSRFLNVKPNTTVCIEAVKGLHQGLHEARSRIEQARAASPDSVSSIPCPERSIDPSASAKACKPLAP